jgi:acetyl-CoA carboxylase biotin carboxylase subunit
MADRHGSIVHLGERDCTIQRRFQKLIEEAPSPVVTPSLRKDLGNSAISFAKACGYQTAGTVEFLVDPRGRYYFIEMNSRIQVEHPVTEMVTGIDLVKEQIRVAGDEKLSFSQRDVTFDGFAIECRINAEDPTNGFRPSPGRISRLLLPGGPGVRVDSHVYAGYEVPPFYDSLIAKIIVHRPTHEEAVAALRSVMRELVVDGIKTTTPLHLSILNHPRYITGQINTSFVDSVFGRGTST